MNKIRLLGAVLCFMSITSSRADEGMYPLSQIAKLDLKRAGMRLTPEQLYNPNGVSVMDALVRLGGCTGSFVSPEGLIITNHHCAFGATAAASTVQNDYITNGFLAKSREKEIPAKGLTVRITASYVDVSDIILNSVNGVSDPLKRIDGIKDKMRQVERAEREKSKGMEIEVSEMFPGRQYVMFRYKTIKDIRLVYVPQRAIGEFGGETDNWVWPRHNGDFSFVRAYVSPDGSPSEYSEKNIPFKPLNYLRINPEGPKENDFIFILGYPGRTQRHQPASYLQYQYDNILPYTSKVNDWLIDYMLNLGKADKALEIAYSSKIKSLANVTKNYKGKVQGISRIGLIQSKIDEESQLQKWINENPERKDKYGSTLAKLNELYSKLSETSKGDMWVSQFLNNSPTVYAALTVAVTQDALSKMSKSQKDSFYKAETPKILKNMASLYSNYNPKMDYDFIKWMLNQSYEFKGQTHLDFVKNICGKTEADAEKWISKNHDKSIFFNYDKLKKLLESNPEKFFKMKESFIDFGRDINEISLNSIKNRKKIEGDLTVWLPRLLDAKMEWKQSGFIPDANATLRLTYGYVRGYMPKDGEYHKPFTSLAGIKEKQESSGDFIIPDILDQMIARKDATAVYSDKVMGDVPVAFLYNLDTTGGNSGSPVLDADGRLIGVNFDRAYTATINDFAWNEKYSRSIGVDIRYVLFITDKVAGANFLLKEMGVN